MAEEKLLNALEVCLLVKCSYNALNYWYRWRNMYPDNEYAKLLPDYIQENERQARYWRKSDVEKIIQFRESLPQGRNGVMGDVTQKYVREHGRSKKKKNAKKKRRTYVRRKSKSE